MNRFRLIPREERFFDLFEAESSNLVSASKALVDLLENYDEVDEKVKHLKELESHGDTIIHDIMARLHRTFVTPLDREDIALIGESIDDVVDIIEGVATSMLIYRIKRPTGHARKLAAIIARSADQVHKATALLRHRRLYAEILPVCVELNRLENEADDVLRSALNELFENGTDVYELIKWRELYEHLEMATDRCEDIANTLEGIVLKHA